MRPSVPRLVRAAGLAAVIAAVALVIAGCAPTGAQAIHLTPQAHSQYKQFHTYPNIPVLPNLTYARVDGNTVQMDVCLPNVPKSPAPAPRAVILGLHGGSWAFGDKSSVGWRSICQWLASNGYVAASVGYTLSAHGHFPLQLHEIEDAVEWMRRPAQVKRFDIDPTRIGVFGGSAGGNLASELGTVGTGPLTKGHRVAAVAELSGPVDLTAAAPEQQELIPYVLRYVGCTQLTDCPTAREASPVYHVDRTDPPFFIGHSTNERIPLPQSQEFVTRLRAAGIDVTFVEMKGSEHAISMLDDQLRARILAFFRQNLVERRVLAQR